MIRKTEFIRSSIYVTTVTLMGSITKVFEKNGRKLRFINTKARVLRERW